MEICNSASSVISFFKLISTSLHSQENGEQRGKPGRHRAVPLLARVGDRHGDTLLSHHTTLSSRILGILLKVPVTGVWPVTLVISCTTHQSRISCTAVIVATTTHCAPGRPGI